MKNKIIYFLFLLSLFSSNLFAQLAETTVKFRFPIANADRHLIASLPIIGMDHDKLHGNNKAVCKNNRGLAAPFCYNDHEGTDFSLIGGFYTMDHGGALVVAAAAGEVVDVIDGFYDRCSLNFKNQEIDCHGHDKGENTVTILHANGVKTNYKHLKDGSILVTKGQHVSCGQALGLVGSSGNSSGPHLHFDVIDTAGNNVDPYQGKYSQSFSYWNNEIMSDGLPSGSCSQVKKTILSCAFQIVQDAAVCGSETVTDATACGTQVINCGKEIVNCGTKTVTDAFWCGSETVTSIAQCGYDTLSNIYDCASRGFGLISGCKVAKTCSRPKTCQINLTCEVDKKCYEAKTCSLPKTCAVCK